MRVLCECERCRTGRKMMAECRRQRAIDMARKFLREANARIKANRESAERTRNTPIFGFFYVGDI